MMIISCQLSLVKLFWLNLLLWNKATYAEGTWLSMCFKGMAKTVKDCAQGGGKHSRPLHWGEPRRKEQWGNTGFGNIWARCGVWGTILEILARQDTLKIYPVKCYPSFTDACDLERCFQGHSKALRNWSTVGERGKSHCISDILLREENLFSFWLWLSGCVWNFNTN